MRISRNGRTHENRRVKTTGSEFENCLNLLTRHMKLFDYFLDVRTGFEIFKDRCHWHPGIFENPSAAASARHALHGGTL